MSADAATIEMLTAEVATQGAIVRDLKTNKAPAEEIKEAVATLIEKKKALAAAKGEEFDDGKKKKKKEKKKDQGPSKKELRRMAREKAQAEAAAAREGPKGTAAELFGNDETPFGRYTLVQSHPDSMTGRAFTEVSELGPAKVGEQVHVRAFAQKITTMGKKSAFVHLRSGIYTVQCLVAVSKPFVKFVSHITPESIIDVQAVVVEPPEAIRGCTQSDVELHVERMYVVNAAAPELPFQLADASRPNTGDDDQAVTDAAEAAEAAEAAAEDDSGKAVVKVGQETRLNYRWIDLRTRANQGIFRLQAAAVAAFRNYLTSQGFTEIHSPKIIATASEGGAEVFHVDYFGRDAFLAQSPQLYKQMAICCGLERVFEVGPVFRAENSNTNRHLTEFTGLDLEMAFKEDYHEVLDLMSELFIAIFDELGSEKYDDLRAAVNDQHPFEPIQYLNPSLVLTYAEGIALLQENNVPLADGAHGDLDTPTEKILGALVKEKYGTDFFILDKYPSSVRPFYTMPDPQDDSISNSYDIFLRGQEIMSGAQRIHDPELLLQRAQTLGVDMTPIMDYVNSFRNGAPPHGGGGIGMERLVMLYLGLTNIRKTTMFPRDPKRVTP